MIRFQIKYLSIFLIVVWAILKKKSLMNNICFKNSLKYLPRSLTELWAFSTFVTDIAASINDNKLKFNN